MFGLFKAFGTIYTIIAYYFLSRILLEEERDTIKAQCFHTQTELIKLRAMDIQTKQGSWKQPRYTWDNCQVHL